MIPENVEQFIAEYGLRQTADAPADTTLRDQMIAAGQTAMNGGRPDRYDRWLGEVTAVVDALLPLLRAHAAQARRDALNEAADAWELQLSTEGLLVNSAQFLRVRAVSPQPARDQAHDETRQG
jgi:hypothetical protein